MSGTTAIPPAFVPHDILDRDYWNRLRTDPATAPLIQRLLADAATAPDRPPLPAASDFLAARRTNDRARLDRHWKGREQLAALVVRRCVLGIDGADPDDRLLDWIFDLATEPTWVVSAHLPDNDLPATGAPQLDLPATEMAGMLAETLEVLKPWIDVQSGTLSASIVAEIDRRVLRPFGENRAVAFWAERSEHVNNWSGVCGGSVLAACMALQRLGYPRPDARRHAIDALNLFLEQAFTPTGECDEGIGYWVYGVSFACHGLQRLAPEQLRREIDLERLRQIAAYPGRAHLYDNTFYAANDSGSNAVAGAGYVPWLAAVSGDPFLPRWRPLRLLPEPRKELMGTLRALAWAPASAAAPDAPQPDAAIAPARELPDQQAVILRRNTARGELLVAMGGGHNAERHNHNDVGHFIVALDRTILVPDMGAPHYVADFFKAPRYTYLPASSRGHCCPIVNAREQSAGREAGATVLSADLASAAPHYTLDATAAYPPEARLRRWTRTLRQEGDGYAIVDEYDLSAPVSVEHVLWFAREPKVNGAVLAVDGLRCALSPAPANLLVERIDPAVHHLREYTSQTPLYRAAATYAAAPGRTLIVRTQLSAEV